MEIIKKSTNCRRTWKIHIPHDIAKRTLRGIPSRVTTPPYRKLRLRDAILSFWGRAARTKRNRTSFNCFVEKKFPWWPTVADRASLILSFGRTFSLVRHTPLQQIAPQFVCIPLSLPLYLLLLPLSFFFSLSLSFLAIWRKGASYENYLVRLWRAARKERTQGVSWWRIAGSEKKKKRVRREERDRERERRRGESKRNARDVGDTKPRNEGGTAVRVTCRIVG
jgi:hypothetical protein